MRHPWRANRMVPSQRITHGQRAAVGRRKRRSPCLAQLVQYLRMVRAAQPIAKRHERGGDCQKRGSRTVEEAELRDEFGGQFSRKSALSGNPGRRSEEHTSELQSLMRISYAVFCLKKKNRQKKNAEQIMQ